MIKINLISDTSIFNNEKAGNVNVKISLLSYKIFVSVTHVLKLHTHMYIHTCMGALSWDIKGNLYWGYIQKRLKTKEFKHVH